MIASNCRQTAIFIFIRDRQCSLLIKIIQSASSIYAGLPAAGAALQLVLAIQLQRHIAGAGNGHSILCSIPCVHLQVFQEDLQGLCRVIDDLHHIVGGGLYLFGKGGRGVGVLVGLLLGLLLDNRLGGLLLGGLLIGFGVILLVQKHLIGGLFSLLRLLGFGGILLVLLLVLLLLILRGQQLLRGGLIVLALGGRVLGLILALGHAGLFGLGGVLAGLFDLIRGVLLRCALAFGGLGVVAGDDDVVTVVLGLLDIRTADRDGLLALLIHRDFHTALAHITDVSSRGRGSNCRHRHAQGQDGRCRPLHVFP